MLDVVLVALGGAAFGWTIGCFVVGRIWLGKLRDAKSDAEFQRGRALMWKATAQHYADRIAPRPVHPLGHSVSRSLIDDYLAGFPTRPRIVETD